MADDYKVLTNITENSVSETKETLKPVTKSTTISTQSTNNSAGTPGGEQNGSQAQIGQNNNPENEPGKTKENADGNPDKQESGATPVDPNAKPPEANPTGNQVTNAENQSKTPEGEVKDGEKKVSEKEVEGTGTPNPKSGEPGPEAGGAGGTVEPPKTPSGDKTGTTGLGENTGGGSSQADEVKKNASKIANAAEKKIEEEAEKKAVAGAAGGSCWWIVLGILLIILIFMIVTYGSTAINATQGGFGKSAPQPSGKNYDGVKKVLQAAGTNLKTSGGGSSKYKNIALTDTDKKGITDGKIDKRLLDLLTYLGKLHARLTVSHIVDGYTKKDTVESGANRTSQITANVSAHVSGLAMDISEIDYVYRVNEPKEICQDAVAALCGPLAPTCKQAAKEMEWGDLVYYASDEVKIPTDIIPANIKAKTAVGSGQDPISFAASQATIAANQNITSVLDKIKQSQNKLKQMLDKFNNSKNSLISKRNELTNQLTGAQSDVRQSIQSQVDLLNQNISKIDEITGKIDGYKNQITEYSTITNSLQGNLTSISQTISKYSNLNNLSIDVPVDTGSNMIDGRIQGLISQAKNKLSDVTSLSSVAGTVNNQIGDLSTKISTANNSITDFSNTLDPILSQVNNATNQLEGTINNIVSGALSQSNIPITQADLEIINTISNSVNSIGNNSILNTALSDNPFAQMEDTALNMANSIQSQVNSAISSGIGTITNTINAPVDEINGLANGKIDTVNQNLSSLVDGLNGIKGNFEGKIIGDINEQTQNNEVVKKINETVTKIQSILNTVTTLKNNLGNFVNKATSLQNSLSTIGGIANTVADVDKITSKVGIDTSSARDIANQIDKINQAISTSLNKVNGILSILDQETNNLNNLLSQLQNYSNKPASEVSKYLDTLVPSLNSLEAIGHIDILSALNIDLSPLSSLQGIIDGYINKLKTETFDKIKAELEGKLKEAIGAELGNVIGSQIPGLSSLGLGGGVENKVLMRMPCVGNKVLVTPSDTKLGGNKAVIIPLKVEWQENSGLASVTNLSDQQAFFTVLQPETRRKVHELITQTLQFPYDMKDKFYYKANQIITFSAVRDVQPFWLKLKDLYGEKRGANIGLFAMPEALPHVHIAY
jgi:uncharacterized coiled-coil DUF342 family protein